MNHPSYSTKKYQVAGWQADAPSVVYIWRSYKDARKKKKTKEQDIKVMEEGNNNNNFF